jgi:hypothetical protein
MKKTFLYLAVAMLLSGCASHYVITKNDGLQIDARGKPRLQGGFYVYKDAMGNPQRVFAGDIREIAPAGLAKKHTSIFKPTLE